MRMLLVTLLLVIVAAAPARAMDIREVTSESGITAWLVEDHTNPLVSVKFAFRGGPWQDPPEKQGRAVLTMSLLDEGAGPYDSRAFQERLQDIGAELGFDANGGHVTGRLRVIAESLAPAGDLLRLALTEPRLEETAVQRVRGSLLAGLRRDAEDPDRIAWWAMVSRLFPDHPFGRRPDGTLETVPRITVADMREFAQAQFARDRLMIGVVGDITEAELKAWLDATFGTLPETSPLPRIEPVEPTGEGATFLIERDIPQSVIRMAQPGIPRKDPDWIAASLMNHVLGGAGFGSRLMQEVREERGLAYSVWSTLVPLKGTGLIAAGVGTANARAAESLAIMRAEWARLAETEVGPQELADAKAYVKGSFLLDLDSTRAVADMLVSLQISELGRDYIDRRDELIDAVSVDDLRRVARRLLDPDALTTVIVGQPEAVEAQPYN